MRLLLDFLAERLAGGREAGDDVRAAAMPAKVGKPVTPPLEKVRSDRRARPI